MLIASFRSRTQVMMFYDFLRKNNVASEIISTPQKISVGCGLSVKFAADKIIIARKYANSLNGFMGFYIVEGRGRNAKITPYATN